MSSSQGIYAPLDRERSEIRLLEVVQSFEPDIVACRLHTVSLLDKPEYVSLSYCWGDSTITDEIILHGTRVSVTRNLAQALRHVKRHWQDIFVGRDEHECRLWADAVCINQGDLDERAQQVQLMHQVFTESELTFAWLGSTAPEDSQDDEISLALETIDILWNAEKCELPDGNQAFDENNLMWMTDYPSLCKDDEDNVLVVDNLESFYHLKYNKRWSALFELFYLPLWHRVWIPQELILPRHLYFVCPSKHLYGEYMFDVASYMSRLKKVLARFHKRPAYLSETAWYAIGITIIKWSSPLSIEMRRLHFHCRDSTIGRFSVPQHQRPGLISVLAQLAVNRDSSDPRDSFYGTLALTGLRITPDYSVSKSIGDVAVDFVRAWLDYHKETVTSFPDWDYPPLQFLLHAGVSRGASSQSRDFPSWAPAFHVSGPANGPLFEYSGYHFHPINSVFGSLPHKTTCARRLLHVQGITTFSVTYVHQLPEDFIKWSPSLYHYLIDYLTRMESNYQNTWMTPLHAFLRIFIAKHRPTTSAEDLALARYFIFLIHNGDTQYWNNPDPLGQPRAPTDLPGAEPDQLLADWYSNNYGFCKSKDAAEQVEQNESRRRLIPTVIEEFVFSAWHIITEVRTVFEHYTYIETTDGYLGLAPRRRHFHPGWQRCSHATPSVWHDNEKHQR